MGKEGKTVIILTIDMMCSQKYDTEVISYLGQVHQFAQ
jgi:hypothetical protein